EAPRPPLPDSVGDRPRRRRRPPGAAWSLHSGQVVEVAQPAAHLHLATDLERRCRSANNIRAAWPRPASEVMSGRRPGLITKRRTMSNSTATIPHAPVRPADPDRIFMEEAQALTSCSGQTLNRLVERGLLHKDRQRLTTVAGKLC